MYFLKLGVGVGAGVDLQNPYQKLGEQIQKLSLKSETLVLRFSYPNPYLDPCPQYNLCTFAQELRSDLHLCTAISPAFVFFADLYSILNTRYSRIPLVHVPACPL